GKSNKTTSDFTQDYDENILAETGQLRVKTQATLSLTENIDGSTSNQYLVVENTHNDFTAEFERGQGRGVVRSFDGYVGYTAGSIDQEFKNIMGQSRLISSVSHSATMDAA